MAPRIDIGGSIATADNEPLVVQESADVAGGNTANPSAADAASTSNHMFNQREIEQILKEDHEQYDISLVLNLSVLEADLAKEPDQRKVVSKIIPARGKYVKAYCEGYLGPENLLCIKLTGICEDSGITVVEEVLDNSMLVGICKVMIVHGVMPLNQPLKLIKSFTDFARICVFPFLTCIREGSNHSDDDGSMQDESENA